MNVMLISIQIGHFSIYQVRNGNLLAMARMHSMHALLKVTTCKEKNLQKNKEALLCLRFLDKIFGNPPLNIASKQQQQSETWINVHFSRQQSEIDPEFDWHFERRNRIFCRCCLSFTMEINMIFFRCA